MGTIQEKSSGEFKQLVIDDTERLEGQIAHAIPEMTASILIPIFVFAYLLFVDWRMALASLASAVLGNVIYYSMMIGRSERMKEYMSANGDMNATIVEYVNGMEVIRMFNQTASSMGRFKGAVLKVRDITTAWYKHCYASIKQPTIIQANLFGKLEIISATDVLKDDSFTNESGYVLLTFLLLNRKREHPLRLLTDVIWESTDMGNP